MIDEQATGGRGVAPPFRRYLRAYLRVAPYAVALHRALEAAHISRTPLASPLLDLGCGFGEFGSIFFEEPVEAGIDLSRSDLRKAREKGVYRLLAQADARRLPFHDGSFASVLSVSTLEHVPRVDLALAEAFRVLRPGGAFVFTVPTDCLSRMLVVPRALAKVGLAPVGAAYARRLNASLGHVNLWDARGWTQAVQQAGFDVDTSRMIVSARSTAAWDIGLGPALLERFWRLVTGRRLVKPWPLVRLLEAALARYGKAEDSSGSNLLVVARKPHRQRDAGE